MERLTEKCWRNLDPWECCGQDHYCTRGCHDLGGCTGGCIVPKLYARLATYEDTGLEPEEVKRLLEPEPNPPLILDELREMDGEPVWNDTMKKWVLVDLLNDVEPRTVDAQGRWRDLEDRYYRRKPEEGAM